MKILLDKNVNERLRHCLDDHTVHTVRYMGWSALGNGELLDRADEHGYDAIITSDASMEHQQNWTGRRIEPVYVEQNMPLAGAFIAEVKAKLGRVG